MVGEDLSIGGRGGQDDVVGRVRVEGSWVGARVVKKMGEMASRRMSISIMGDKHAIQVQV